MATLFPSEEEKTETEADYSCAEILSETSLSKSKGKKRHSRTPRASQSEVDNIKTNLDSLTGKVDRC